MYHWLVLLMLVVATQQQVKDPAYMAKWQAARQECSKDEGIDMAAVRKAWDDNRFPNDPKFKCYYKCVTTELGVLDPTGDVVDAKLGEWATQWSDAKTEQEIVEECGPLKGSDLCETAYKLIACARAATLD